MPTSKQAKASRANQPNTGGWPSSGDANRQWTKGTPAGWKNAPSVAGIGPNTGQFVAQLLQRFRHPEHVFTA